jgi:hypothetical protein
VRNWASMMEVSAAGSAEMAAMTLDGRAAAKEALAWELWGGQIMDLLEGWGLIAYGSTDWAAARPATARETAAMNFILGTGGVDWGILGVCLWGLMGWMEGN